jgi:hypothetical protein
MFKSWRMGWTGLASLIVTKKIDTKFCSANLKRRDHFGDLGLDRRILQSILKKWVVVVGIGLKWLK